MRTKTILLTTVLIISILGSYAKDDRGDWFYKQKVKHAKAEAKEIKKAERRFKIYTLLNKI